MVTRADADGIAAVWARHESLRRGVECTPWVQDISCGYAVWISPPRTVLSEPGDGVTTVIDRDTGRLSHWPSLPVTVVEQLYREHRAAVVEPDRAADAQAELRRSVRRRVTPTVAAHLTVDGRLFVARGVKGAVEPRHHPLVAGWLGRVPPGHLVRGAGRHAELVVLSDMLSEVDRVRAGRGSSALTVDQARDMLAGCVLETFHVREAGDPLGGRPAEPCESCTAALVDFAVLTQDRLASLAEWRPGSGDDPEPGRFPAEVAWVLAAAGWSPRPRDAAEALARLQVAKATAVSGREHRHEPFPAVSEALCGFPPMTLGRRGPGVEQRIRLLDVDVTASVHTADMLHELGGLIGARLFPLGSENDGETVLAVDDRGRVFAVDQGGDWFVGETVDAALGALLTGAATPRVRDDGTW